MNFEVSFKEIRLNQKNKVIKNGNWGPDRISLMSLCIAFYEKLYQVLCNSSKSVNVDSVVFTIITSTKYEPRFKLEINNCLITEHSSEGVFKDFIIDATKLLYFIDYRDKSVI